MSLNGVAPLVSIWIITYNQEEYISQCIEGVLMQVVDFPIEIVIGEDCSTDRTREICLEYQKRFPDIIRVIENEVNQGLVKNWINTLKECKGKFIAMCEGDDYWTDPHKLQKQVGFLEANPEFSACFHNVKWVDEKGKVIKLFHQKPLVPEFDFDQAIQGWFVHTNSLCFRRDTGVVENHEYFKNLETISADRLLVALLSDKGKIGYLNQLMSAYRKHKDSLVSTSSQINILDSNIKVFLSLKKHLNLNRQKSINNQLFRLFGQRALVFFYEKKYFQYFSSLFWSFKFIENFTDLKAFFKVFLFQMK